ncbi:MULTISPECIES: alpha-ketoglutarate-dependent dioxygenase AlkB family protein [Arthrospira]|uniref:Alkylated DNA repair protein n=1 Tax=Limnospira platensis NIES-46 TaxID=1236695 RepID=A0A5M3T519_LIMPL|nr:MULTISPECIES: alpha-ketoglutarate-dependent dioxygenase AlkB [Arthrospira]AMW26884.1 2OG-Fe(II) oxygenase [Arthrospira platensis YZ]MBD2670224.1 alpha-ketoglutarate-dependent dioxygenase AlkB [Arthrospira platensis FACHB-439]MBD2710861.1 alpha-ketoglutarate-dependent dioxygenase AlkB [Arthrospira platensis FACHB-835]MDF2211731.1 alpha-ketoglutarate-dependent dioxygenase AlkB [Arthrospira platensis NCB002]QQW29633.1 alpha-ketoglutarate-dependent dioxygenase AlkB [Arthrospira sp. PCC 9108]BA
MYQQMRLWDNQPDISHPSSVKDLGKKVIIDTDGLVILYGNFLTLTESDRLFWELYKSLNWRQEEIKIFGKIRPIPRLTAWYADAGKSYTYSGIKHHAQPWNPTLKSIKSQVEDIAEVTFNSVLINLYRDGKDSMSWHSDDEPELGKNPMIASVSLGGTRRFSGKHKIHKNLKFNIDLTSGSLLLMKGETQHFWQHQIPKTSQVVEPRINLTFRMVK